MTGCSPTPAPADSARDRHAVACFSAWAIVGGLAALGLVSLGPVALGPALLAGAALSANKSARRQRAGLLAGVGLLCVFIAYVQRRGPGTTSWHTATASGSDQHLNPIPWLVFGLLLIVVAAARSR
jgi:hypothetical protein